VESIKENSAETNRDGTLKALGERKSTLKISFETLIRGTDDGLFVQGSPCVARDSSMHSLFLIKYQTVCLIYFVPPRDDSLVWSS